MEKLQSGVYRMRFGTPEPLTYMSFKRKAAKDFGADCPPPFTEADVCFRETPRGCSLTLPLDTQVYGFGLQLRTFNHTGGVRIMRNNADAVSTNGESHAPVPFYVTTAGYGVFVDSARDLAFYCGDMRERGASEHNHFEFAHGLTTSPEAYREYVRRNRTRMFVDIPIARGADVYIFAGESMLDAVCKYNMFSGGGVEPPEWALGVWYRMDARSTASEWVRMAERFREQKLPVRVLGLEPGWQTHAYACTYVYDDARIGDHKAAIDKLHAMGLRVNLWEHAFVHPDSPIYREIMPYTGDYEAWGGIVPDFSLPEAREIFERHHKTLGADCFKLDECDGSDHTGGWSYPHGARFPSGLDGEQMHHLLGMLYQQTIDEAFPNAYHSVRASGPFAAPYPFVLYSDLYEQKDYIRGMVNAGFSGLLWSPEVRHAVNITDFIRRMQMVIFSPLALVNAWYLKNPPWEQIDRKLNNADQFMPEANGVTSIIRSLFNVREAMTPYLERMFQLYRDTGKPVFRALVLDYPDDPATLKLDDEYMVGDNFLFAPLTAASDEREVYLPEGKWERNGITYEQGTHAFRCALEEYLLFRKV